MCATRAPVAHGPDRKGRTLTKPAGNNAIGERMRNEAFSRDVWIVQHAPNEGPGLAGATLERFGFTLHLIHPYLGHPVPEEASCAGLLLLGGPMGVRDAPDHKHLASEMRLLESALTRDIPILGICLGSQLLASVLGAPIYAGDAIELGFHEVRLSRAARADGLFGELPRSFAPLHWHVDNFDLPRGAVALGRSEKTACQAFRYGRNAYGVLFHLEAQIGQVASMAAAFPGDLENAHLSKADLLNYAGENLPHLEAPADTLFSAFARSLV